MRTSFEQRTGKLIEFIIEKLSEQNIKDLPDSLVVTKKELNNFGIRNIEELKESEVLEEIKGTKRAKEYTLKISPKMKAVINKKKSKEYREAFYKSIQAGNYQEANTIRKILITCDPDFSKADSNYYLYLLNMMAKLPKEDQSAANSIRCKNIKKKGPKGNSWQYFHLNEMRELAFFGEYASAAYALDCIDNTILSECEKNAEESLLQALAKKQEEDQYVAGIKSEGVLEYPNPEKYPINILWKSIKADLNENGHVSLIKLSPENGEYILEEVEKDNCLQSRVVTYEGQYYVAIRKVNPESIVDIDGTLNTAFAAYKQQEYNLAIEKFLELLKNLDEKNSNLIHRIYMYLGLSYLKGYNKDPEVEGNSDMAFTYLKMAVATETNDIHWKNSPRAYISALQNALRIAAQRGHVQQKVRRGGTSE